MERHEEIYSVLSVLAMPILLVTTVLDTAWNLIRIDDWYGEDLRYRLSERVLGAIDRIAERLS